MNEPEPFAYCDGDTGLTGWLVRPAGQPRAAVVLFPTIVNVSPAVERRAQLLADAGFLAMIADFYGEPVDSFEASRTLADRLRADPHGYRRRLLAAVDALQRHAEAAGLPIAVIGYCMGGGAALEVARSGADVMAAISFHGLLQTPLPAEPGTVRARLLVCHGDADPMVPRDDVLAYELANRYDSADLTISHRFLQGIDKLRIWPVSIAFGSWLVIT